MSDLKEWPAWRFGPGGESRIFQKDEQVPKGWEDHPSKVGTAGQSAGKGQGKEVKLSKDVNAAVQTEPTAEERTSTIKDIREAAAAQGINVTLADDASVDEINAAIDKLTKG